MALTPGTRLGSYEITAQIGVGGMGEVYRATDTNLKRQVAIKVLPASVAGDTERLARFQREAEVLAALNHPHIAAIYGLEKTPEGTALVMELVEGEDLSQRIARGAIPVDEALPIARQIAEALEAAHEQGIIHRDLKPANIKVRADGTVKVLDFGLAKALAPEGASAAAGLSMSPTITTPAMTQAGMILGTAAYMSPEQAKGRAVDKRADIWAFGAVLFEMLTGARAFAGEGVSETLARVIEREPDWAALPVAASPALRTYLRQCLQKDARQRVRDIGDVRLALEGAFDTTTPAISVAVSVRPAWRRALPWVAGMALMAAALSAVAALRPAAPAAPVARFSIPLLNGQTFSTTGRSNLAISPDGTQVVYASNSRLFRRGLADFDAQAIAGTEAAARTLIEDINSPAFSPDGKSVAFYSPIDRTLKRVALDGGAPPVTLCAVDIPLGVTWDASGILVGQGEKGVLRCPATGGALEQLASVDAGKQAHGPQILPGSDWLLFTIGTVEASVDRWDAADVVLQSLSSGQRTTLLKGASDARYLRTGHLVYAVGGTVFAATFDPRDPSKVGAAVPVVQGVRRALAGTTGVAQFVTSDTGALAYIPGAPGQRSSRRSIGLADRSGAVTMHAVAAGAYEHVRASRDGTYLALGANDAQLGANVLIVPLDGSSTVRRLTFEGKNRAPVWSPDGVRVAFQSDREGDLGIFAQRADGAGAAQRLTRAIAGEAHVPASWSPDGRTLLFTVFRDRAWTMWSLSLDTGKSVALSQKPSADPLDPVFSPDGRWVVYTYRAMDASLGADSGVFVEPFPLTGARYQAPRVGLDFHPVWMPGGGAIAYVPSAASGQMVIVPVTKGGAVTFDAPVVVPALVTGMLRSGTPRGFDVLPDGRFVGPIIPDDPMSPGLGAPHLRVVLNWFEELKRLVPTK